MRYTLRRSCAACAKSKHSCDLRVPCCSRCVKRKAQCTYVNEPLTGLQPAGVVTEPFTELSLYTDSNRFGLVDPFDSYPPTRLSREHVQRLMYSFLHKIAFQYYPLDLNGNSNPFVVSWWPLALGDPVLFHVSLQTACLDEELLAQNGFQSSELLMSDSIALLRRKINDASLAVQDGTINSVITLAAIEFGKGNITASQTHIDGVKQLVRLRGGVSSVWQTSPLTARMVSWVSMIITGKPQFDTQDDFGRGQGIPLIPAWQASIPMPASDLSGLTINDVDIEQDVRSVLVRLRGIFQYAPQARLPPTWLHDLACFAIHRLLLGVPDISPSRASPLTEQIRYATVLYMFIAQGTTYFSHATMVDQIVARFKQALKRSKTIVYEQDSLDIWLSLIGLITAIDPVQRLWFSGRLKAKAKLLKLVRWDNALAHMQRVLWLETPEIEAIFRAHWQTCIHAGCELPEPMVHVVLEDTPSSGLAPAAHQLFAANDVYHDAVTTFVK